MNMSLICRVFACNNYYTLRLHTVFVVRANESKKTAKNDMQDRQKCNTLLLSVGRIRFETHTISFNVSIAKCSVVDVNISPQQLELN